MLKKDRCPFSIASWLFFPCWFLTLPSFFFLPTFCLSPFLLPSFFSIHLLKWIRWDVNVISLATSSLSSLQDGLEQHFVLLQTASILLWPCLHTTEATRLFLYTWVFKLSWMCLRKKEYAPTQLWEWANSMCDVLRISTALVMQEVDLMTLMLFGPKISDKWYILKFLLAFPTPLGFLFFFFLLKKSI